MGCNCGKKRTPPKKVAKPSTRVKVTLKNSSKKR